MYRGTVVENHWPSGYGLEHVARESRFPIPMPMKTHRVEGLMHIDMQRQNLLLMCNERSGGHLSGQVTTQNAPIWCLENPHEMLESQRNSFKLNVFVPYLGG
ncbi:hypothetical protein TNCV_1532131 [Trichonephila clavipes]|nr:hypothetical protein TNCV_1532131 [Trichonephila clavipes]